MNVGCTVCGGTGYIRYKMWTGKDEPKEANTSIECSACSWNYFPMVKEYPRFDNLVFPIKPEQDKIRDNLRRSYLERDEPCPNCEYSRYGPGSIEDPVSSCNGGKPWSTCWECDGTGKISKLTY